MTRNQVLAQFACVLLLLACPAGAQPPGRGGPPGGRDPFFEALRDVHMDNPNKELFDLIHHDSVRKEIALSEDSAEKVYQNIHDAVKQIYGIREQMRSEGAKTRDELKKQIIEAVAPFDKETYELLQKESKFERLLGIYAQARNYRAALNEHIAQRIGLTDQQLTDFRSERSKIWRSIMEETRQDIQETIRRAGTSDIPRDQVAKIFEHAEHKLDSKLGSLLSKEQREKLEELKGEPFADLPKRPFDSGRRGGRGPDGRGPDGRDGGRGDGGRGGHDPEHRRENECTPEEQAGRTAVQIAVD